MIKVKDVEIEKLQTIEAEAEAYVAILTKDECDKEIERNKCKNSVKMLKFNHNQILKDVKKKKAEIVKLKHKRRFLKMLGLEITTEDKDRKH